MPTSALNMSKPQKPMMALLMSLEESVSNTNLNDMEYTQTSCGKSDLYSKAPATPLKGSNLAGNPKALAKTNSKALAKTNSEALAKTNRQDSALDEVSLQCAHTDHQEDSERRDSAFDEVYRAKPGDKSLDTNTIKELPNGDNHTQAGINDTNGAINDTAHGGGSEEDDISDTPAARRASTKPTNTTEELELQKKILDGSRNLLKETKTNSEEYRKAKAIIKDTKEHIEHLKNRIESEKMAQKSSLASRKHSGKSIKSAISRRLSKSSRGAGETAIAEVTEHSALPTAMKSVSDESTTQGTDSGDTDLPGAPVTTSPPLWQRKASAKNPQNMEALPFTVESVHKDSELVGTGIMSIRDLHLELNMIGKERIARDARSTISAKLALNKAKISAEAYQKPRDLVTYEFGEVRNKSSMTTVHLKAPEYHPIGPFDTLQLEVFVKSPLATVKRTSSATPKMFQWVKKTKKTQSHMELDLPGDSMSVDKLLGEASLSVLSILNNLDTTHGFSSQFRSTNNCLLLKPYTYKARVTVYVKDAFKEGWLDVQKNTPTRIQQWELCYAVLSGTNFSLFREPPSEGKVAVPMETLNLLQIKNNMITMTKESKRSNSFRFDSDQYSYFCSAESAEDMSSWADAFNEALVGLRQWLQTDTQSAHRPSTESLATN